MFWSVRKCLQLCTRNIRSTKKVLIIITKENKFAFLNPILSGKFPVLSEPSVSNVTKPNGWAGDWIGPTSNRGHWTSVIMERKSYSKRNQTGFRSCPLQIVEAMILFVKILLENGTKVKAPMIWYFIFIE